MATERLTLPPILEARLELWGCAQRYAWNKAFGLPWQKDSAACLFRSLRPRTWAPDLEAEMIELVERVEWAYLQIRPH